MQAAGVAPLWRPMWCHIKPQRKHATYAHHVPSTTSQLARSCKRAAGPTRREDGLRTRAHSTVHIAGAKPERTGSSTMLCCELEVLPPIIAVHPAKPPRGFSDEGLRLLAAAFMRYDPRCIYRV
ncbi:hypothetical protein TRAPUB_6172 [Trametes pubescens]|uniref:Uncharacterized protein n=1 Tax=Trametes pubescens TaxID=154538 RepID=A0A1M2V6R9_TRAPU|nr:hypothetical protein TRAPUB_6172 [Trametes pubescens]